MFESSVKISFEFVYSLVNEIFGVASLIWQSAEAKCRIQDGRSLMRSWSRWGPRKKPFKQDSATLLVVLHALKVPLTKRDLLIAPQPKMLRLIRSSGRTLSGLLAFFSSGQAHYIVFCYRRSPAKRPKLLAVTQEEQRSLSSGLFGSLSLPAKPSALDKEVVQLPPVLSLFAAVTPSCQNKVDRCIVDWSIKTKARFTSKTPFAFSSTLKVLSIQDLLKRRILNSLG